MLTPIRLANMEAACRYTGSLGHELQTSYFPTISFTSWYVAATRFVGSQETDQKVEFIESTWYLYRVCPLRPRSIRH
jgi:hypothetical protein